MTIDVLPWFDTGGTIHVLARRSYLPVPSRPAILPPLDDSLPCTWVTELLNVQQGQTNRSNSRRIIVQLSGNSSGPICNMREGLRTYPSPGGLQEQQVRSVLVEIDPITVDELTKNTSGWSSSGRCVRWKRVNCCGRRRWADYRMPDWN